MIASLVVGAAALATVDVACFEAINRGQMPGNRCSHEHMQLLEQELNQTWSKVVPIFREHEASWEVDFNHPGYFAIILEEQRAWIRYREAVCAHERFSYSNGSARHYAYNKCMGDMALERINYLLKISGLDQE